MATKEKNFWVLLIFLLSGLVIGGLLGEVASQVSWLGWLAYGQTFGIENPFVLDLNVLSLTFAFLLHICYNAREFSKRRIQDDKKS